LYNSITAELFSNKTLCIIILFRAQSLTVECRNNTAVMLNWCYSVWTLLSISLYNILKLLICPLLNFYWMLCNINYFIAQHIYHLLSLFIISFVLLPCLSLSVLYIHFFPWYFLPLGTLRAWFVHSFFLLSRLIFFLLSRFIYFSLNSI